MVTDTESPAVDQTTDASGDNVFELVNHDLRSRERFSVKCLCNGMNRIALKQGGETQGLVFIDR